MFIFKRMNSGKTSYQTCLLCFYYSSLLLRMSRCCELFRQRTTRSMPFALNTINGSMPSYISALITAAEKGLQTKT